MTTSRRVLLPLALCLLAGTTALPGAAPPPAQARDEMVTRTFEVRYKDFQDAVVLVTDIVTRQGSSSPEARIQLQHRLKRISVTDLRPVVEAVAEALESFDVPPRQVEIKMTLFLGSRGEGSESPDDVYHSVAEELRRALKYTKYELLGSLTVPAVEGEETSVTVGGGYTIEFRVGRVDVDRQQIQLSPLVLSRRARAGDTAGAERMLKTYLSLRSGTEMITGVTPSPSSDRGLVLSILARILD